jgi:hypothetical protein
MAKVCAAKECAATIREETTECRTRGSASRVDKAMTTVD